MEIKSLGRIIAERKLINRSQPWKEVIIRVGQPQPFGDLQDYVCPFQVLGLGDEKIRYACGVDGIQALQLSLDVLRAYVNSREEVKAGLVSWEGDESGDLGF